MREENEAVKVFRLALSENVAKVVRLGMGAVALAVVLVVFVAFTAFAVLRLCRILVRFAVSQFPNKPEGSGLEG